MAIEEKKPDTIVQENVHEIEEKKEKEPEIWYRVRPHHAFDFDPCTGEFEGEVELPGVAREHVKLRVIPELYELRAAREHTLFTLAEYFPYEIDVDSFKAKYEHGLLLISGKFKDPLAGAVDIKLS